jgi:D-alanine-D-alanine ligase
MNIAILYADLPEDAAKDELDVLVQVEAVSDALRRLNHNPTQLPVSLDLSDLAKKLQQGKPDLVFNLVESIAGSGRLIHLAPTLLDFLHIPYTGCSAEAHYISTSKLLSKERLRAAKIPTPEWRRIIKPESDRVSFTPPYIIKPVWEDASVGLTDVSVIRTSESLVPVLKDHIEKYGECFLESFVDGREFNISVLGGKNGPEVMPAAEIRFIDYPAEKPKIVGYEAKWDTASFEYKNTVRHFDFSQTDQLLLQQLKELALQCWELFDLRGYARVDFRVDALGRPWVLEVNANPCISPDAGFIAAAKFAGYNYDRVIDRIVADTIV